ncbi:DNA-binding protein [Xylella taiwanensis]|nr:DNA-binding protein [Xylella taiwanensis]QKD99467.1 DNA-binding protein [Xylella taiwanensis]
MSIAEFARQHGLNYWITCQVLRGLRKGKRGESHRAAVLLGLKEGVIGNMLP